MKLSDLRAYMRLTNNAAYIGTNSFAALLTWGCSVSLLRSVAKYCNYNGGIE